MRSLLILLALVCALASANTITLLSATCSGSAVTSVQLGSLNPAATVRASFVNQIMVTGWGLLNVSTAGSSASDESQAYCIGYAEGMLTAAQIGQININLGGASDLPQSVWTWAAKNIAWMQQNANAHSATSPYWMQVSLLFTQLNGMLAGYNAAAQASKGQLPLLTFNDIYLLSAMSDLSDVATALNASAPIYSKLHMGPDDGCSGLIRLSPSEQQLYLAHDTWTVPFIALRIAKRFTVQFSSTHDGAVSTIAFTSSPGSLFSGDDFYISYGDSWRLAVLETTGNVYNNSLWSAVTPQSVPTFLRAMIANRLSSNATAWTELFGAENSGTYCNMWIVADFSLVTPSNAAASALPPNTVRVLEQLPGYIESTDVTPVVNSQGYFGSYNVWYQPLIFNVSGQGQMVNKYGQWFSYWNTSRALIFARDAPRSNSLFSLQTLMLYNNISDPIQKGFYENGVASRSDLQPPVCTGGQKSNCTVTPLPQIFGPRCHCQIDSKITSSNDWTSYWAYGAPTHEINPVFSFATATPCKALGVSVDGLPPSYPFGWVYMSGEF